MKELLIRLADKQNLVALHFKTASERRFEAVLGYEVLGPLVGAQVLSLSEALTNDPSPDVRQAAATELGYIGPEARLAAPALFRATRDSRPVVRQEAFDALGRILPDPQLTVPVLIAGLDDPWPFSREYAPSALELYGTKAIAAVPALLRMLATNNANITEHDGVTSALKAIDPEAAARAGVK